MMKYRIIICVLICVTLASCSTIQASSDDEAVDDAQIQTAIAETSIVQTRNAPSPTIAFTDTPAVTATPEPTNTPEPTDTPEPTNTAVFSLTPELESTSENPWILQSWCEDHVGCQRIEVKNQTDYWVNIYLVYLDTGVDGMFSIPKRGHAWITLRPGQYDYTFTDPEKNLPAIVTIAGKLLKLLNQR